MSAPSIGVRRRRAWTIAAALVAGLVVALALASADRPGVLREAARSPTEASDAGPPAGFEDEALRLEARCDVRADERNGVLGFSCAGGAAETLAALEGELRAKGWSSVSSGYEGTGSFVKEKGRYRWMFVACIDVGDWTSVVVRYTTEEGA